MNWLFTAVGRLMLLLVLSGTPAARAQTKDALSLEEAIHRAAQGHPGLQAAELEVNAVEARGVQAGLGPPPALGVAVENLSLDLPGAREAETTIELSKRLETGGKRGARLAVARADRTRAGHAVDAAALDLVRDVSTDFARGLAAEKRVALAEEALEIAREIAAAAERKVVAGALHEVEAVRARVLVGTAEIARDRARAARHAAFQQLSLHWGGNPVPAVLRGGLDSLAVIPDDLSLIERLVDNPDLARWADQEALGRARLRGEESLRSPDLELGGGVRRLGAVEETALLFSLSMDLPITNRNQGGIAEAAADLKRVEVDGRGARRALERSLIEQSAWMRIAQMEVRGLQRVVIPGARQVFAKVREGYVQGRFTYLDVLEARRDLAEASEAETAALLELELRRIEIERLTGSGRALIERQGEEKP